ncbi:MAG: ABC transporter ATP-binding protein [Parcubacteria group bacterium]|nr:ABC transporter ATP-binding protein [Parcubacteria group bacterium]
MDKTKKISFSVFREILNNSIRLSKIVWKEKRGVSVALIFIFLIFSATPFLHSGSQGLLINELVKILENKEVTSYLFWLIVLLVSANILPSICIIFIGYLTKLFWFFLEEKFQLLITKKKGEIDVAIHEDPKQNDLLNKITENGVWRIQAFIDRQFYILQNIIEVLIASAILIFAEWWVFFIIFAGTIPTLITQARYGRQVWSIHTGRAETRRRFHDVERHFGLLPSLVELKLFQNTHYFFSIIKKLYKNFRLEEKKNETKKLVYQLISLVLSQTTVAFAIVWFIFSVIYGDLLIGTLIFFLASIGSLKQAFSSLFANLGKQYEDNLFITDTFQFLDIKPAVKKPEKSIKLKLNTTPEIFFDNVTFSYPGTNRIILKNFSLKISPGEKIALIGVNGAGKTTFVKLLCRFYDPDKGKILIDGNDLKDIDLENWYSRLGAIFQDYAHYHFTVKEAIAIGRTGAKTSLQKVKDAAKASEADVFIEEWEEDYEQMLGKSFTGGVEPSIGQWQKLALARTFYRDPNVLILDEPTSSIDAEAEEKIFEKLKNLPKDRTVILISHRFSTVRHADKIAVIKNGQIKELGRHEDLMRLNGIYNKLFNIQARGYK